MRNTILMSAITVTLLSPRVSFACATCFGAEGDPQTEGLNMAIITLLGVTYTLFSAMALFIFMKWRKNLKALAESGEEFSTREEGSPNHG